jgi:hypothetical protein
MAGLWRGRGSAITHVAVQLLAVLTSPVGVAQSLYERPVLTVDPGMHTAVVNSTAVDAAGRLIATGSVDKTIRVWSVSDGKLLQTSACGAGLGRQGPRGRDEFRRQCPGRRGMDGECRRARRLSDLSVRPGHGENDRANNE